MHSWLSTQEQNQSITKSSGDTDPQNLQNTLRQVQVMNKYLPKRKEHDRLVFVFLWAQVRYFSFFSVNLIKFEMFLLSLQLLQDELAERSVQLEKVKRAGRDLVSTDESPSLKAVDILCTAGTFIFRILCRAAHSHRGSYCYSLSLKLLHLFCFLQTA